MHSHGSEAQNVEKAYNGPHSRLRRPRSAGDVGILMALQRAAGNAAVVRAVQAARVAAVPPEHAVASPRVQRSTVHDLLRSAGRPLDAGVRGDMEVRLGADISRVRIHTGSVAHRSAVEIGARAYTAGEHVVLGNGAPPIGTLSSTSSRTSFSSGRGRSREPTAATGSASATPRTAHERAAEAQARRALQRRPAGLSTPRGRARPRRDGPESSRRPAQGRIRVREGTPRGSVPASRSRSVN